MVHKNYHYLMVFEEMICCRLCYLRTKAFTIGLICLFVSLCDVSLLDI